MIQSIAIDGPAASGKTVVGLRLAETLGYWFLDTGVMYRAVTWLALEQGVSSDDAVGLGGLAETVSVKPISPKGDVVEVAGRRLGLELRETRVDVNVSNVSRHPVVRRAMVAQQRAYVHSVASSPTTAGAAVGCGIVMTGRDIGTVVLPDADLKIYLTACPEERARRRYREMADRAQGAAPDAVLEEIKARDAIDSTREDSPLRPAEDAWLLDSSSMKVDDVLATILDRVQCRR